MTPELCAAYVNSLANKPTPTVLPYYYLEYHHECYGGSVFDFGSSAVTSLSGAHACTDVCSGSIGASSTGTAFCGGPLQFNLYATNGVVSWPGQAITTYSSSSSPSSSSSSTSATPTASVTYNWDIGWVSAAPDGFERPFIGINGQWPCPPIHVNVGDTIQINVQNSLVNETTAIHFHGIFQTGTNEMDGPAMVNQCPIPPGGSKYLQNPRKVL
jgi:FtsP/CotA-like multicopper oxidase with cupredoxin domain